MEVEFEHGTIDSLAYFARNSGIVVIPLDLGGGGGGGRAVPVGMSAYFYVLQIQKIISTMLEIVVLWCFEKAFKELACFFIDARA